MRKLLVATCGLLLGAGVALAQQAEGTVEKVDPNSNTIWVNGQPYQIESQSKVKAADLAVGQKVRLEYDVTTNVVSNVLPVK